MSDNTLGVFVIVILSILFVLTTGEPDIIDGLIKMSNR